MGKKKQAKKIEKMLSSVGPGPLMAGLFAGAKPVQAPGDVAGLLDRLLAAAPNVPEDHPLNDLLQRLRVKREELKDRIAEHEANCPECNPEGEPAKPVGVGMQLAVDAETAEFLHRKQDSTYLDACARYLEALVAATRGDKTAKLKMIEFVQGLLAEKTVKVHESMEKMDKQATSDFSPPPAEQSHKYTEGGGPTYAD